MSSSNHNTSLDGRFWGPAFRRSFIPEIEWFNRVIQERVLTAFEDIEDEAHAAANDAWDKFMHQPSDGSEDPGDYADAATEAGIEHYTRLSNARQALLNMGAVSLWHLVEQQILFFHKRQVLSMQEEQNVDLYSLKKFIIRMKGAGIEIESLPSWAKVDELRLAANSVKHGEGGSLDKLAVLRPDLLIDPVVRDMPRLFQLAKPRADRPAGGEDIYVTPADLQEYSFSAIQFWSELAGEVERIAQI